MNKNLKVAVISLRGAETEEERKTGSEAVAKANE